MKMNQKKKPSIGHSTNSSEVNSAWEFVFEDDI